VKVGLTGGIGAGKSEVSARLAALGAVIIDADAVAREVVAPGTPGLAQVTGIFGSGVLAADGSVDRPRLGEIVFADPGLLAKLNAVIHPLVSVRMQQIEQEAAGGAVVVHDVPLLAENHLADLYDFVVVVDAPPDVQFTRLTRLRGMPAGQARARMAAQASREDRLAIADFVVDNSGDLRELDRQVTKLWAELSRREESGGGQR
jgi:dephospho-CoA kinase